MGDHRPRRVRPGRRGRNAVALRAGGRPAQRPGHPRLRAAGRLPRRPGRRLGHGLRGGLRRRARHPLPGPAHRPARHRRARRDRQPAGPVVHRPLGRPGRPRRWRSCSRSWRGTSRSGRPGARRSEWGADPRRRSYVRAHGPLTHRIAPRPPRRRRRRRGRPGRGDCHRRARGGRGRRLPGAGHHGLLGPPRALPRERLPLHGGLLERAGSRTPTSCSTTCSWSTPAGA